jgi:hypothetical protein
MDPRLKSIPNPVTRSTPVIQPRSPAARPVNPFVGASVTASTAPHPIAQAAPTPHPIARPASAPPDKAATPPTPPQPPKPFSAEVIADIPVASPGQAQPSTPYAGVNRQVPSQPAKPEDDLDKILEAVNSRVKAPVAVAPPKPKHQWLKKLTALKKSKAKAEGRRPIGAIAATVTVALLLAATAVLAYHQGANHTGGASIPKVGTTSAAQNSISEAGNLLVRPSDLDDFSQAMQTKINNLNDSQDFSQAPLTDQMLGL